MQLHDAQGKRVYLTADERQAFMAAAAKAQRPVRTFCAVLHDSGCRISEALALTPERIDLTGQAIVIETLKKRRSGVHRAVPVPPGLIRPARPRARRQGGPAARERSWRPSLVAVGAQHRLAARQGGHGGGGDRGRAAHPSPKGLRHGYGIHAIGSGVPLNMLSKPMGMPAWR